MQVFDIRGELPLKILKGFLTPKRCTELIALAEDRTTMIDPHDEDWIDSRPINGASYFRARRFSRSIADEFGERVLPLLPAEYRGHRLTHINPCIRFSKYYEGGRFAVHHDGQNPDDSRRDEHGGYSAISLFTLNINLNVGFEGGETDFFHGSLYDKPFERKKSKVLKHRYTAVPEVGQAALFYFDQPHRGNIVRCVPPHKYLARTDVMGVPK